MKKDVFFVDGPLEGETLKLDREPGDMFSVRPVLCFERDYPGVVREFKYIVWEDEGNFKAQCDPFYSGFYEGLMLGLKSERESSLAFLSRWKGEVKKENAGDK